ncbi:hypothetical protein PAESOLCIP111_06503 [Paenibacillus solanacearum]|uniref:HAMP domain-containing protein n=1 Tax=Paenibacillus solanacearum TaxID=2048548 RepID=A0A916NS62_9BACL|nr:sensor histidine kinase [Paenibacillus solanacearum]CAG7652325.1 hypothetical protein PAESOLCIP111_06503 [Paenibacillus solanacearum]
MTLGEGDPFFYKTGFDPVVSSRPDSRKIGLLVEALNSDSPEAAHQTLGHRVVRIEDRDYSVNYVQSAELGWYLVDYLPVETILRPITMSGTLFYVTFALLLMMGVAAALLLYRYVRKPIQRLMHAVQRMHKGDLSVRLQSRTNDEFDFLFQRFNRMAERIQELVEDVYEEKIRAREATLKQLQAQINPHFLYNSLFFIINTAKMGDNDSVVTMAQSLAEYYRYTTRLEEQSVPLREELGLVRHYLNIQNLRMQRLYYEIDVPEAMLDLKIPRLMVQPIVENAIVHGIEHQPGECLILISGTSKDGRYRLVVEDNGAGMTEEAMKELRGKLALPMDRHMGTGVWNVHQRLQYAYGAEAGLLLEASPLGGMRMTLVWQEAERSGPKAIEGGDADGETADRG